MLLYNKTKVPDELLQPLLRAAARSVGAKLGHVPVKLTQGKTRGSSGTFYSYYWVYQYALTGNHKEPNRKRRVRCDGGYISVVLPPHERLYYEDEIGPMIRGLFEIMMHEFGHVADAQQCKIFRSSYPRPGSKRRLPWKRRHVEISAINRVDDAIDRGAISRNLEPLVDLAAWYHLRARPHSQP